MSAPVLASGSFLERVFDDFAELVGERSSWSRDDYLHAVCAGGYPEVVGLDSPRLRRSWFNAYIRTVTSRDIRELGHVHAYLSYLETVFLSATVPTWSTNLTSRITKTPKIFTTDAGLAANLLRVTEESLRRPGNPALGGLVETFAFTELRR